MNSINARFPGVLLGCLLLLAMPIPLVAQETDASADQLNRNQTTASDRQNKPKQKVDADKASRPNPVSPKRIKELFSFVSEHHSELLPLLRTLQQKRPGQFQTAIRTLDREVRQLQAQESKQPQRYQRSLGMWITRSKTKLLAAQMSLSDSDKPLKKLGQEMKDLLNQHYDLRAEQIRVDIEALEKRVAKLKKQLSSIDQQRDREIKRQMESLEKSAQRIRKSRSKDSGKDKQREGKPRDDG